MICLRVETKLMLLAWPLKIYMSGNKREFIWDKVKWLYVFENKKKVIPIYLYRANIQAMIKKGTNKNIFALTKPYPRSFVCYIF